MTSLQHQAVSRVTSDSCSALLPPAAALPPSGRRSSTRGLDRVAGTRSTTPHKMNRREATWVAAVWCGPELDGVLIGVAWRTGSRPATGV